MQISSRCLLWLSSNTSFEHFFFANYRLPAAEHRIKRIQTLSDFMSIQKSKVASWLKHAFAVKQETGPPTQKELLVLERVCIEVVQRRMTTPALTFLEMVRPLNYIGSQTMQFFHPVVSAIADAEDYATFAKFLERRDSIDILASMIEEKEQQATQHEKNPRSPDSNS